MQEKQKFHIAFLSRCCLALHVHCANTFQIIKFMCDFRRVYEIIMSRITQRYLKQTVLSNFMPFIDIKRIKFSIFHSCSVKNDIEI